MIVENRESRTYDYDGEDGNCADPAIARAGCYCGEFAVGSALHERAGVGFRCGDHGTTGRRALVVEEIARIGDSDSRSREHHGVGMLWIVDLNDIGDFKHEVGIIFSTIKADVKDRHTMLARPLLTFMGFMLGSTAWFLEIKLGR